MLCVQCLVSFVAFLQMALSLRRSAGRLASTQRKAHRAVTRHVSSSATAAAAAAAVDDDDYDNQSTSSMQSTAEDERKSSTVVAVDVTGTTFTRQSAYRQSLMQAPADSHQRAVTEVDSDTWNEDEYSVRLFAGVVRARPPSTSHRSDYGVAVAAVRRVPPSSRQAATAETSSTQTPPDKRRAASETREYRHRRQETTRAPSSGSTVSVPAAAAAAAGQQTRGRITMRQLKRRNNRATATLLTAAGSSDKSGLCSWRHSLCAAFKSSKCDAVERDLWGTESSRPYAVQQRITTAASEPPLTRSSVTVSVELPRRNKAASRSQSLPRSFRSSLMVPLRRLLSSRSLASDVAYSVDSLERRPATAAARRAASHSTNSRPTSQEPPPPPSTTRDSEAVPLVGRSRSLDRRSSRYSHLQQQSSSIRTTFLNNRSDNSSSQLRKNAASLQSSSMSNAREVDADIQCQTCARLPPDAIRLGPSRPDDVDRHQSSSGMLLFSVCNVLAF